MPLPLIPIFIGVGLVAFAGAGAKRGKAKGHYDRYGTHKNLWVPRNLAGFKQIGTRAHHLPCVVVTVAAGTTPEQAEETARVLEDRAERDPDVNFFWVLDFTLVKKWVGKKKPADLSGTALDPAVGLRMMGATKEGDVFIWAVASGEADVNMIDELVYFAKTGDASRLEGYVGRIRVLQPNVVARALLL